MADSLKQYEKQIENIIIKKRGYMINILKFLKILLIIMIFISIAGCSNQEKVLAELNKKYNTEFIIKN